MPDNCIWVDEGESYDHGSVAVRTARKDYVCCECGDAIPAGSKYEDFWGVYDGQWDNHRTCARCAQVAIDFFRGRIFGQMVEYFSEDHGFDYRDGIPADFTPCGATE